MTGTEPQIDHYVKAVEDIFGKTTVHKHDFTNLGVRYQKTNDGDVTMDQDAYISTLRPITSSELTGAPAEQRATKLVADLFISLRGAIS